MRITRVMLDSRSTPTESVVPLETNTNVMEELISILRNHRQNLKAESPPTFSTSDGGIDREILGQVVFQSIWRAYFQFLLGQIMIENGRTKEADFPFVATITTTTSAKPGITSVKFTPRRGYTKSDRMVRERRKWLTQLRRFQKGTPSVSDAQAGIGASNFSPDLTALVTNDLTAMWNAGQVSTK